MTTDLASIIDDFALLDDWEDKYRYVIELGRALPPLDDSEKTAANKVSGCVSQVWLVSETDAAEGTITYRGESDAHIVRGLVAIMIAALSGRPAREIAAFDAEALMSRLGLDSHLTPQRANGLRSMIARMKTDAETLLAA